MKISTLLLLACVFIFVNYGYALKCYVCDGSEACSNMSPFIKSFECTSSIFPNIHQEDTPYQCIKVLMSYQGGKYTRTVRGCTKAMCSNIPVDPTVSLQHCSTCTTDDCNSSTTLRLSMFLHIFVLLLGVHTFF